MSIQNEHKALDVYDLGINCARQQAIMLFLSSMLIATTEFHISFTEVEPPLGSGYQES
jgi:hypothetical protein